MAKKCYSTDMSIDDFCADELMELLTRKAFYTRFKIHQDQLRVETVSVTQWGLT